MNSSRFRGAILAVGVLFAAALTACGGKPGPEPVEPQDCRACDEVAPSRQHLPLCSPDCDPKPSNTPVAVEVKYDWDIPEVGTVEWRYSGASGVGLKDIALNQGVIATSPVLFNANPDAVAQFSIVLTGDTPYWVDYVVPVVQVGRVAVLRYHFATDVSSPQCPNGDTYCLLMSWKVR